MAAADQDARQRLDCHPRPSQGMSEQELTAAEQIRAVDAANTARMQAIVQARGWPGRTLVGDDGAQAAWLLVQHADHDPAFQRVCLELLGGAVQAGEADARHHAYLTDRVLLAEGSQQLYGTQFRVAGGSWQLRPLADPDRVDDRRRQVWAGAIGGLSPKVRGAPSRRRRRRSRHMMHRRRRDRDCRPGLTCRGQ
jgi:Family of unknown function (DUF6624)